MMVEQAIIQWNRPFNRMQWVSEGKEDIKDDLDEICTGFKALALHVATPVLLPRNGISSFSPTKSKYRTQRKYRAGLSPKY